MGVDQGFQCGHEFRVPYGERFAAGAAPTDAAGRQHRPVADLTDPFRDHVARQSARPTHLTHAPMAQRDRFTGCHEAPRPFVQQRPHRLEFRRQLGETIHARAA